MVLSCGVEFGAVLVGEYVSEAASGAEWGAKIMGNFVKEAFEKCDLSGEVGGTFGDTLFQLIGVGGELGLGQLQVLFGAGAHFHFGLQFEAAAVLNFDQEDPQRGGEDVTQDMEYFIWSRHARLTPDEEEVISEKKAQEEAGDSWDSTAVPCGNHRCGNEEHERQLFAENRRKAVADGESNEHAENGDAVATKETPLFGARETLRSACERVKRFIGQRSSVHVSSRVRRCARLTSAI
jgi:hypothetical protein